MARSASPICRCSRPAPAAMAATADRAAAALAGAAGRAERVTAATSSPGSSAGRRPRRPMARFNAAEPASAGPIHTAATAATAAPARSARAMAAMAAMRLHSFNQLIARGGTVTIGDAQLLVDTLGGDGGAGAARGNGGTAFTADVLVTATNRFEQPNGGRDAAGRRPQFLFDRARQHGRSRWPGDRAWRAAIAGPEQQCATSAASAWSRPRGTGSTRRASPTRSGSSTAR